MSEDRSVFELTALPSAEIISYGGHADQVIEVFRSHTRDSAKVLLIHGGYWRPEYDRSHLRPYALALAERGFDTYLLEYRRTPGEPHNYLDDLKAALDEIGDCALIGHSAGGHLALLAATHISTKKIVAIAPVSNLLEGDSLNLDNGAIRQFLGASADHFPKFDPATATDYQIPIVVIHGSKDGRVPVELSRHFVAKYPEINYQEIENAGHFELIDPRREEIFEKVIAELSW